MITKRLAAWKACGRLFKNRRQNRGGGDGTTPRVTSCFGERPDVAPAGALRFVSPRSPRARAGPSLTFDGRRGDQKLPAWGRQNTERRCHGKMSQTSGPAPHLLPCWPGTGTGGWGGFSGGPRRASFAGEGAGRGGDSCAVGRTVIQTAHAAVP